ncbi:MAG: LPS export ABC transporter periplasmic protein LptC [Gammaproteobacteria bacterium]|nr:LPS export ABC transporter periplasmic protein LptC [Gammaproteobacteria bacterium]MDE0252280.1 LPS export ABC transporter periplasmic protein LptC [Gammaproteobacteria bacterium]MDE0402611.1 LPS export ABC transporter periplasmic protein LptC [Gammaproteobacteria bacterium]MDE0646092.1 LPS export ABC transporter periplasmic protein LptC [Gammaproteobacteria bacterium]
MKKILLVAGLLVVIGGAVALYLHTANSRSERLTVQLANAPDLTLQEVEVRAYTTEGNRVYELQAKQVYQHSRTGVVNFEDLDIVAQHSETVTWYIEAKFGAIQTTNNQEVNELSPIHLQQGVYVYTLANSQVVQSFKADSLTYLPAEHRLIGSGSISIKDHEQLYVADNLEVDLTKQEFNLTSQPGQSVELKHVKPTKPD